MIDILKETEIKLVDGELQLIFNEKRKVSEPDEVISAYYFHMINTYTKEKMGFINVKNGYTKNIVMYRKILVLKFLKNIVAIAMQKEAVSY